MCMHVILYEPLLPGEHFLHPLRRLHTWICGAKQAAVLPFQAVNAVSSPSADLGNFLCFTTDNNGTQNSADKPCPLLRTVKQLGGRQISLIGPIGCLNLLQPTLVPWVFHTGQVG